jgi:uncharacterized damage-inducible protein DinB
MITASLQSIFSRDLQKLKSEVEAYSSESNLWLVEENISNSTGNLTLHLIGNLNHFVGTVLGNTGYIRKREEEFTDKNVLRSELIPKIEATEKMVTEVLSTLKKEDLERDFPVNVFGQAMNTEYFLIHLTTHLSYHLGQINYHRRLLDK